MIDEMVNESAVTRPVSPSPVAASSSGAALLLPDGRLLGWAEYGPRDGVPVVAFHGFPGSRLQSARYADAATALGIRLIAPDRPGYGISDPQPGRVLADWPADVAALADHLELPRFRVLGVSGGGPHALVCAARLAARVPRAAVVSGWGKAGGTRLSPVAALPGLGGTFAGVAALARHNPERVLNVAYRQLPPVDQQIVFDERIFALAAADLREALRQGTRGMAGDARLLAARWPFDPAEIMTPVDVWHGELDTIAPLAMGLALHAALPHARLRRLPDGGHFLAIPHDEEILRALLE